MSGYCTGGAASQWPHWKSGRLHTRNKVRIYVQTTGRRKLYVHAGDRNNTRIRNGHLFLEKNNENTNWGRFLLLFRLGCSVAWSLCAYLLFCKGSRL